jgi:hypothetical protein
MYMLVRLRRVLYILAQQGYGRLHFFGMGLMKILVLVLTLLRLGLRLVALFGVTALYRE